MAVHFQKCKYYFQVNLHIILIKIIEAKNTNTFYFMDNDFEYFLDNSGYRL